MLHALQSVNQASKQAIKLLIFVLFSNTNIETFLNQDTFTWDGFLR